MNRAPQWKAMMLHEKIKARGRVQVKRAARQTLMLVQAIYRTRWAVDIDKSHAELIHLYMIEELHRDSWACWSSPSPTADYIVRYARCWQPPRSREEWRGPMRESLRGYWEARHKGLIPG